MPVGLIVTNELEWGPYLLAFTPHSVLAAPYHRMGWGLLSAHEALGALPGPDETLTRRLGVRYVLNCSAHANVFTHTSLAPQSLQRRLDRGQVPGWLEAMSPADAPVQVYAVKQSTAQR